MISGTVGHQTSTFQWIGFLLAVIWYRCFSSWYICKWSQLHFIHKTRHWWIEPEQDFLLTGTFTKVLLPCK